MSLQNEGTEGLGLSIDLDAFNPDEAPGVGIVEPHGLRPAEVLPALSMIQNNLSFKALEIVEYNPDLGKDKKTLYLIRDLPLHLLPHGRKTEPKI